jgi:uncharacterized protein YdeI (YjbR/CyaY-like superfamily)
MMNELEYIHFGNKEEFRNWLQKYHETSPGIWMVFYKKHIDEACLKYNEALEEALCFGWIDSLIKRIDDEKYARKISPRADISKWSEINKRKVIELIKKGRMTQSGLRKIDGYLKTGTVNRIISKPDKKESGEIDIPDFIIEELSKNEPALINFNKLAPTYKKHYILWITNAKKEETVRSRLKESIGLLKENKKLGLK